MLPDSKIHSRGSSNRYNQLLVTNIRTTDPFRPRATNDYIDKKNEESKRIHNEIKRVTLGDSVEI